MTTRPIPLPCEACETQDLRDARVAPAAADRRPVARIAHLPLLALLALVLTQSAGAQELPGIGDGAAANAGAAAAADATTSEPIAERRAAVTAELRSVDARIGTAKAPDAAHLREVRERLRSIEALLARQAVLTAPRSGSDADSDSDSDSDLASGSTLGAEAPGDESASDASDAASVASLNALYELRFAREQTVQQRERELASGREALASAKQTLDEAERERRRAASTLQGADAAARPAAERALRLRELASRIAREEVNLRTVETRAAEQARSAGASTATLDEQIEAMRRALARGEGEARAPVSVLMQRESELRRSRESLERLLSTAELRLGAAEKRFAQQSEPSTPLLRQVEVLGARRDAVLQEIALRESQLARLDAQRSVWSRWASLLRDEVPRDELEAWEAEADARIDALRQGVLHGEDRAADLAHRVEAIDQKLAEPAQDPALRTAREELREALQRLQAATLAETAELAADQRLTRRLLDDIHDRTGHIELLEVLAHGLRTLRDVWSYEITVVDDAPITVGSLLLALALFGLGMWGSRRGSALVGRFAEERFKLDAGAAHGLQTLSFYVLLVSFTLLALRAIHFPLTAFTVLGGALAIGIGFGSQNVMNNFISGLILMLERPVRARDIIEVDGQYGTIEQIGARSTRIRSVDGRHIIVPNSFFLESNVVNWTLSDDLIRTKVLVGVIYGSPTRLVEQLIRQVTEEEEAILRNPEPIILFDEFGDNSLNFAVHFWVRARSPMAMRKVQSRVRFRIDDLFREHDLVIAFPQRDVHLDTVKPLELRVVAGDESGSGSEPTRSQREDD